MKQACPYSNCRGVIIYIGRQQWWGSCGHFGPVYDSEKGDKKTWAEFNAADYPTIAPNPPLTPQEKAQARAAREAFWRDQLATCWGFRILRVLFFAVILFAIWMIIWPK